MSSAITYKVNFIMNASGVTFDFETDEESVIRIRKEKRALRNKKLDRVYGSKEEEHSTTMEFDIG